MSGTVAAQDDDEKTASAGRRSLLRVLFPLLTVADIALLAVAHISPGNVTFADGYAPFNMMKPHMVNSDNLASAVKRLADSHAWFLVFFVAIMSGLWPYLKLVSNLCVAGLVDRRFMSTPTAQTCLACLELLGKWSVSDLYLMCCTYNLFDIETPDHAMGSFGHLKIHIFISLQFGGLGLMIAVICSMLLTLWAKHELAASEPASSGPLLAAEGGSGGSRRPPSWLAGAGALVGLSAAILVVVGSCMPTLFVKRRGFLANLMLEEDRTGYPSLLDFTLGLRTGGPCCVALCVIAFCMTFLAPLFEVLLLTASSLAAHLQARAAHSATRGLAEWCSAFDTLEIFLIVAFVQMFETPLVVDFNVGSECEQFNGLMNNKALLGVAGLAGFADSECFGIAQRVEAGFWLLVAAVVLRFVAWRLVLRLPPSAAPEGEQAAGEAKI